MADKNDTFLREVEEELRRERIEKIWREYGTFIIAAAAILVLGVLGREYYISRHNAAAESAGARYEDATTLANDGKAGSAAKEFEKIIADGPGGYPTLAKLQLAGALLQDGKKAEALAAYDALAKDSTADPLLGDYAALQAAGLRLGEADFTEMQNRLNPLLGEENPWHYSARDMLGVAAFKAGKPDEARNLLTPLMVDQKVPQSIMERAQIVLAEIAADEIAKTSAGAAPPTAPAPPGGTTAAETAPPGTAPGGTAPAGTKKE